MVRMLSVDLFAITGVHRLVFVEFHATMADAILREKRIKKWRRTWKRELIERHNRQWRDLYEELG
jgi:putative endonuclease